MAEKKISRHVVVALNHLNKRKAALVERKAALEKEIAELEKAIEALG